MYKRQVLRTYVPVEPLIIVHARFWLAGSGCAVSPFYGGQELVHLLRVPGPLYLAAFTSELLVQFRRQRWIFKTYSTTTFLVTLDTLITVLSRERSVY